MKKKVLMSLLASGVLSLSAACIFVANYVSADAHEVDFSLESSISETYARGEYFNIPKARYNVEGMSYEASATLTYPNESRSYGKTAALYELGEYILQYSVQAGGETYVDTYEFSVVNQMSSLFSYSTNVTAQNNATLPDYFGENDGALHDAQLQEDKWYATTDTGIRFTVEDNGQPTEIRYDEIVDLAKIGFDNAATQNGKPFVEFFFTPDNNTELELEKFKIVLTDIYDENNYLTIDFAHLAQQPSLMRTKVAPCDMYESTSYYWGTAGTYVNSSMYGQYQDYNTNSITLYYDVEDNEIWSKPSNGISIFPLMNGFSNVGEVGYGNEWKGFTTGEVYLSFIVEDTINGKGSFTVLGVGDKTSADDYCEFGDLDMKVVTGDFDPTKDTLVYGENHSFAVFDVIAHIDNYGAVDVQTQAYYNGTQALVIENGKIPLNKVGVYTLVYTVDHPLVYARKTVALNVQESYNAETELGYTVSDELVENAFVGDRIYLYGGKAFGGYGEKSVSVSAKIGEENVTVDYDSLYPSFVAEKEGTYKITYTITDEIGYSITKIVQIDCVKNSVLSLQTPMIPGVYLIGHTYTFAAPKCNVATAVCSVLIDGEDYTDEPYTVSKDFTLTYKAVNGATTETKQVDCKAVAEKEGKSFTASFFHSDSVAITTDDKGILMTANESNEEVRFLNAIIADRLSLTFVNQKTFANVVGTIKDGDNIIETLSPKYGGLSFVISDVENSSETVEISFRRENKSGNYLGVYLNGIPKVTTADWFAKDGEFGFSLDKKDNGVYDADGKLLCTLAHYADGSAFNGFSSGHVYIHMQFLDVTEESKISLRSLAGQMYSNLIEKDLSGPMILTETELPAFMLLTERSEVTLPAAYAYDAFNSVTEVTLRVTGPNGEIYKGGVLDRYKFTVGEAGSTYTVTYEAFDTSSAKNRTRKMIYINVIRENTPQITISNANKTAKVGVEYTVAEANVTSDNETEIFVYILDFNDKKIYIQNGKYTFKKAGMYRVYYYVEDMYNNVAITYYEVEVRN